MSLKIKFGNWLSKRYFTYRLIPSIMIDYQTGMFGTNCDIILSWLAWSIMVESSKKKTKLRSALTTKIAK